jgi:hypothetical protein
MRGDGHREMPVGFPSRRMTAQDIVRENARR